MRAVVSIAISPVYCTLAAVWREEPRIELPKQEASEALILHDLS